MSGASAANRIPAAFLLRAGAAALFFAEFFLAFALNRYSIIAVPLIIRNRQWMQNF